MKLTKVSFLSALVLGTMVVSAAPAHAASVTTEGKVEFTNSGTSPTPVDPEKDTPELVTPEVPAGTTGLLRINQAPTLEFGQVELNGSAVDQDARYTKLTNVATSTERFVPNFLQVNDTRGDKFGWSVTVSGGALTRYEGGLPVAGSEVEAAKISFKAPTVKSNSGVSIADRTPESKAFDLMLSDTQANVETVFNTDETTKVDNRGYGVWSANYGAEDASATVATTSDSIKLTIPAASSKSAGTYKSVLTWSIVEAP